MALPAAVCRPGCPLGVALIHRAGERVRRTDAFSPLASTSIKRHYARGALGLIALMAAVLGAAVVTPVALVLLIVTVVAWRGCPSCWAVGLMQTRELCVNGSCRNRPN